MLKRLSKVNNQALPTAQPPHPTYLEWFFLHIFMTSLNPLKSYYTILALVSHMEYLSRWSSLSIFTSTICACDRRVHTLPSVTCLAPRAASDQEADCMSATWQIWVTQPWWQQLAWTFTFEAVVFKSGRRGWATHAALVLMLIETWACLGHQSWQSGKCHTFQGLSSLPGFGLCNRCWRLAFTQAKPVLLKVLWTAACVSASPLSVTMSLQLKDPPNLLQTHPLPILPSRPNSSFTSFPMHATHRGLTLLEPQGICSLSHVEFSTFSFCLIICLFSTLAPSFGLSGGYGLFSQLSCKRVGYCVIVSGLESALRSHSVIQSVQLWFRAQSRWSANISCWQPLFHTMQLEEKISRCFFCIIFMIS